MATALRLSLACCLLLMAGCGGRGVAWNGRRGYDGNGDYGYDLAASRSEARAYRATAGGVYPPPGSQGDPWGPYVRAAASRHQIPEQWIRAVMRQESGGRLYAADGSLITSVAGAMGLMQIMPRTYDMLRTRYGLGEDPFDPRDNILAGTAYIREMYDRYGAPGFLAAYNAGPDRLEAYLSGASGLPDETVDYLTRIAPNLGTQIAMTGPLAVYAGNRAYAAATPTPRTVQPPTDPDLAYAGGGLVVGGDEPLDPADRAFEGGGLVVPGAPTGMSTLRAAPVPAPTPAGWGIQVGAFADPAISRAAIADARARAGTLLADARPTIVTVQRDVLLYRARFTGLSATAASQACASLLRGGTACLTVPPGS
jgi:hypothetical protein